MEWAVKCTLDSREWQRLVDDDLRRNPPDTSTPTRRACDDYNAAKARYEQTLHELRVAEANARSASLKFNRASDALFGRMIAQGQL